MKDLFKEALVNCQRKCFMRKADGLDMSVRLQGWTG